MSIVNQLKFLIQMHLTPSPNKVHLLSLSLSQNTVSFLMFGMVLNDSKHHFNDISHKQYLGQIWLLESARGKYKCLSVNTRQTNLKKKILKFKMISKFSLQYVILSSRKKYFFLQMNVCFKSLFSNQFLLPGSKFRHQMDIRQCEGRCS